MSPIDEQDLCSWLSTNPDAVAEARAAHRRWLYIGRVADGALQGKIIDASLSQVNRAPKDYAQRAEQMVKALEDWLQTARAGSSGQVA